MSSDIVSTFTSLVAESLFSTRYSRSDQVHKKEQETFSLFAATTKKAFARLQFLRLAKHWNMPATTACYSG